MQIIGLHKNIYKLSSYALSQEKLEKHRIKYEKQVRHWQKLKSEGVSDRTCQEDYWHQSSDLLSLQGSSL